MLLALVFSGLRRVHRRWAADARQATPLAAVFDRPWTDQSSDHVQIRSNLNAAVYDVVQAAGMSFPFPQREVRLLGDADERSRSSRPRTDSETPSMGAD